MHEPMRHSPAHLSCRLAAALVAVAGLAGCREDRVVHVLDKKPDHASELAATKVALAKAQLALAEEKISTRQWEEAISLLTSAALADPANEEARMRLEQLTGKTVRPVATLAIPFGMPVEHLAVSGDSLFVSLAGESNTLIRWNIAQRKIESVLFPSASEHTRSLTLSPDGRFLVLERGGVTLLCHADTLKPIADIGYLPENFTPSAAIAFSPDGLLLGHPTLDQDKAIVWQITDSMTGEILRTSSPVSDTLAGKMGRENLQILIKDGSTLVIPISPVEEVHHEESKGTAYSAAQFLPDGSLFALTDHGPHEAPVAIGNDGRMLATYPWTRQPSVWSDLLSDEHAPISIEGNILTFQEASAFPIHTASPITAVAQSGEEIITGTADGTVTFHRFISVKEPSVSEEVPTASQESLAPLIKRLEISKITSAPSPAKILSDSLRGENPDAIQLYLVTARHLPPLLAHLAKSRIAWLQGRTAEALQEWTDDFPNLSEIRKREDWEGWEQADFTPALEHMRSLVDGELAALQLPANATPDQRQALAKHLLDPATVTKVGRHRLADALLQAALSFSAIREESKTAAQLATVARNLGAAPAASLRAEAQALSSAENYQKSHPLWISLITDFPIGDQQSGDYAEASHVAWQIGKPEQAQEILVTGIHHFPQDGNLCFRVGWMSLIGGNTVHATEFLLAAKQKGLVPEEQEQATAMLAIAARYGGIPAAANRYFRELTTANPSWSETETITALDWPKEWKKILGQLAK